MQIHSCTLTHYFSYFISHVTHFFPPGDSGIDLTSLLNLTLGSHHLLIRVD